MILHEELEEGATAVVEDWLLSAIDQDPMPVDDMLAALRRMAAAGDVGRADSSAELVQDALVAARDPMHLMALLKLRSRWRADDRHFGDLCGKALGEAFGSRQGLSFIKAAGFAGNGAVKESLRRLELLTRLSVGTQCYEKTWGFGIVKLVDDFYEKVNIDFDRKRDHQMTFAYAAESLALVDDSHIMARRHNDPDGLAELVAGSPDEVVRMALRSYGELNVIELQEKLVGVVVPEEQWKKFWDGARKALKSDPLVEIPSKRKEPIRLLDSRKEYDADWFLTLKNVRDPAKIFALVAEFEEAEDAGDPGEDGRAVFADRLALCIKAGQGSREELVAQAVMAAARLGLDGGLLPLAQATRALLTPDTFPAAAAGLPARLVRKFIDYCVGYDPESTVQLLISLLPHLQQNVLNEALDFLIGTGRAADCVARFAPLIGAREAGPEILYWLGRHTDLIAEWVFAGPQEFLTQAVDCLECDYSGERLRSKNQLRALFDNKDWLESLMARLTTDGRSEILRRISASRGWETSARRSVLARIIRMYPDLERVMAGAGRGEDKPKAGPQTSWRSYRARREQYRKLTEEDIPKNSKDIGVARSYGDLRENFEYQAAKDEQRLLLRRKAEMEEDLGKVRGTDFAGAPTDAIGPGTLVTLASSTGDVRKYCILGEWDQDDALSIVSSSSRIALILEGRRCGDAVELPTAGADMVQCTITEITEPPEDVKKWIAV